MIIRIILMVLIILRVLIRFIIKPFEFSWLSLIILIIYLVGLASVFGRVRWSVFWILGAAIGSILVFVLFENGINYILWLDIILIIASLIAFFFEKDIRAVIFK
tara:strand:+ start:15934 stop:16245 length:312 start_codon:yes stop_codon:yes gene_type:complete